MSEQEQVEEQNAGGTALKALAGAAATGAATYAVRKALATRNGHDADEDEGGEVSATRKTSDEQAEIEPDDSEYAEEEDEDGPEASADAQDGEESEEPDSDDEEQHAPESSANEEDEDYEDDDPDEPDASGRSTGKGSLRQLVNPSRLASLSHLLVPVAAEAADSAGRYVAEHTSDEVQQQVVNRFIDAFEKAS
jgi:hypothetical protein